MYTCQIAYNVWQTGAVGLSKLNDFLPYQRLFKDTKGI